MRNFRRVCVYCGSHSGHSNRFAEMADRLGHVLVARGTGLVYGGGNVGLMGRLADSVLAAGGDVLGVIPRSLVEKELSHPGATEMLVVESMHERKARMADAADAFIVLPGGIGTLEELFETWTWLQLGFHDKPVGMLNVDGFCTPLLDFLNHLVDKGFLHALHRHSLLVEDEPGRLLDRLQAFESPRLGRWWETRSGERPWGEEEHRDPR